MMWVLYNGARPEVLGFLPSFLSEDDPRPAAEQIAAHYIGGWVPHRQGPFSFDPRGNLLYPEDPPLRILAAARLRDEELRFYDFSWLAIVQPDGSFEVSRVD